MLIEKQFAVLVTGCNGGIGKSLCREFGTAGYTVIGTDKGANKEGVCDFYFCCDLAEFAADSGTQKRFMDSLCEFASDQSVVLKAIVNNAATRLLSRSLT